MKNQFTCLIVEDEPIAAEILTDYINQVPQLELLHWCTDALQAGLYLQEQQVDVLFLDIHLPGIHGLDFLNTLLDPPQTIFTTAYHQYAVDAFAANGLDYLMKPIPFPRFIQAIQKLKKPEHWNERMVSESSTSPKGKKRNARDFLFVPVNRRKVKVYLDEIQYIESLKDYCKIVTSDSSLLTRGHLSQILDWFPEHHFLRVHRSFAISMAQIRAFSANEIELESTKIPIGRQYKSQTMDRLSLIADR